MLIDIINYFRIKIFLIHCVLLKVKFENETFLKMLLKTIIDYKLIYFIFKKLF